MQSTRRALPGILFLLWAPSLAAGQNIDATKLQQVLGRPGQKIGAVIKFGFPRTDLQVRVGGVVIRPGLALGSWAAFSGTDDNATVMGDLVLLEDEVNPVMKQLRSSGFQITALHNHLLHETPRLLYMHYMGRGQAEHLAASLKKALSASKTPLGPPGPVAQPASEPPFVRIVEGVLGRTGSFSGGVLAFGIPRRDTITLQGTTIPPAMGVAEAINVQQAGPDRVAATGDFVLTADEVNPVISALQQHHILVTALHGHMLDEQPRLFFLHFWAVGRARSVAAGIKAALENVAIQ
jgi:hypothetical protein